MFFIVVYHCLTHGVGSKFFFNTDDVVSLTNVIVSDLLLVFGSIAVNLYVMTSGYFLSDVSFKFSRIIRTWVNACFYSFCIPLLLMLISVTPFDIMTLSKSFFPLSSNTYWYVTQYIGLLILSPFLSILARNMAYRQFIGLLVGGAFLCMAVIPDFPLGKHYYVAHGNSVWSFSYLFMVAAFIRNYVEKISNIILISAICLLTIVIWICELVGGLQNEMLHLYWLDYNGLVTILSVLVFIIFRQMQIPVSWFWNMVVRIAPYTFGVYLIHDHLMLRDRLWPAINISSLRDLWTFIPIVFAICLLIFLTCVVFDAIRKILFSFCHVDSVIGKCDEIIMNSNLFAKLTRK